MILIIFLYIINVMCGRFVQDETLHQLLQLAQLDQALNVLVPSYNIAPSQKAFILGLQNNQLTASNFQWAFLPHWAKEDTKPMINARLETITEKPFFKHAFESQRCVVPVTGFFEWDSQAKQPFYIHNQAPVFLGGIWEKGRFCLITTQANASISEVHHRMPLTIPPSHLNKWLKKGFDETFQDTLFQLTKNSPHWYYHKVTKDMNSPSFNSTKAIEAIE